MKRLLLSIFVLCSMACSAQTPLRAMSDDYTVTQAHVDTFDVLPMLVAWPTSL